MSTQYVVYVFQGKKAHLLWITNNLYCKPPDILFLHNQQPHALQPQDTKSNYSNWSETPQSTN